MSTSDRTFDDAIAEAKSLLENHDDAEYEALEPSAKANYQEALEFLRRLESSVETDGGEPSEVRRTSAETSGDDETVEETPAIEIDTDLESTMGDDGDVVGPFDGHDLVVYDPESSTEGWISMDYDATIPFEDSC